MKFDSCIILEGSLSVGQQAGGRIYADSNHRFADGISVITSSVVEVTDGYFKTRNIVYKIISEPEEAALWVDQNTSDVDRITTHSLARTMLAYDDLPLYVCRYEGDIESDDYEMMLSRAYGIDLGVVKGTAVMCVEEAEVSIAELEDQIYRQNSDLSLKELLVLARKSPSTTISEALGVLAQRRG